MKKRLLLMFLFLGSFVTYSQVGIGTPMPNSSSQLEVIASDKGILIPRIKLTGSTDTTTILNGNVNSMLIFNTATVSDVSPGYYYWYINKWNRIVVSTEIISNPGTVIFNPTTKSFTYITASGAEQTFDFSEIVASNQTITTITSNGAGSYTYKNELGTNVTIDVLGDVASNFSTIANTPSVKNLIQAISMQSSGSVVFDAGTNVFSYTDASGNLQTVDISSIVKSSETLTTLTSNGAGSYTYKNELGTNVTIDVLGDVASNFSTIANTPSVKNLIQAISMQSSGSVVFDAGTNVFSYTDPSGNLQTVDISTIVKSNETLTTLTSNGAGSYTYKNELGTNVTIDVLGDVASNFSTIANTPSVKNLIQAISMQSSGSVVFNAGTNVFSYTDASGNLQTVDISSIVKSSETLTTLTSNGAGSYTYKNELGTNVIIDVLGDVASNFSTIANTPSVKNLIQAISMQSSGSVVFDAGTNVFSYTDPSGNLQTVDISSIVKSNETLTTLTSNGAGSYTYKNELGTNVTIDVLGDVASNFSTIANTPSVKNLIQAISMQSSGSVVFNAGTNVFSYTDASGNLQTVDIGSIVKSSETLTTLTSNGAGSYTYKNELGTNVTIDVLGDVASNFSTIANNPSVKNLIQAISMQSSGSVVFDAGTNVFSYTDPSGNLQTVDISSIVKSNETLTTLTSNGAGSYTYKNELGTNVTIDVLGDVASNFSTIANTPSVKNLIQAISMQSSGSVVFNAGTNVFSYTDASGNLQTVDIGSIVKSSETLTTLTSNGAGSYTYKNELGTNVTIDVLGDVASNFSTIANNPSVKNLIQAISMQSSGSVVFDAGTNVFSYTDPSGNLQTVDISSIVKSNETLTTLTSNGAGSYTYKNELGTNVTIDVLGDVASNFSTIANTPSVKNLIQAISMQSSGSVVFNAGTNVFSYTDASGNLQTVDIGSIVKSSETLTTLTSNGAGSYTYKNELGTNVTIDVLGDVASNFSTIANNPSVKNLIQAISMQSSGSVVFDAGTNVFSYTDPSGNLQTVDISTIVKSNETITTLSQNVITGAVTFTNEAGTSVTSQVVSADAGNLVTAGADGGGFIDNSVIKANETITSQSQNLSSGSITFTNEAGTSVTSQVVSSNTGNLITVGSDGGSFLNDAVIKNNESTTMLLPLVTSGNTIAAYTNETGVPVDIKETITSLKDVVTQNTDPFGQLVNIHTLTYVDETNTATPIDLSLLVKGTETLTSLLYDGASHSLIYKDEKGVSTEFNMVDLIGDTQSLTKLEVNTTDKTLDYIDEDSKLHQLNIEPLIKEPWFGTSSNVGAISNTENIYTNGWVGIGYNSPSAAPNEKLRVNGAISTVNTYYADYVFEDYFKGFSSIKADYKFKPLFEIEDYIKKYNHLPGITSIKELEKTKNGYSFNMSELSIQLLEKTEELYLHIIEQNKINENQRKEIELKTKELGELKVAAEAMNFRIEKLERLIAEKLIDN